MEDTVNANKNMLKKIGIKSMYVINFSDWFATKNANIAPTTLEYHMIIFILKSK